MAKKYSKSHKGTLEVELNATVKTLKFSQKMHEEIFNNFKLAAPGRLTWSYANIPGRAPMAQDSTPEGVIKGESLCMNNSASHILGYWEGRSTIEKVRLAIAGDGWAGKIDEVIQLCTPTPFLKDVKGSIKMPDVPVLKVVEPEI